MKLYYYELPGGNFGDDLNTWLWDALLPGWRAWPADASLVGVGTLFSGAHLPPGAKLVLGSGAGYGDRPDLTTNPAEWDIRAVRGPRTAATLGLPADRAIVDPAMMLPLLPEFAAVPKTGERLFIPHHLSAGKYDWQRICRGTGIAPLDPRGDPHEVIRRIAGARSVVAESMHGAIIADAFRVPWQAVAISNAFNEFKWRDWAESLDVELRITRFYATLRRLKSLRGRRKTPPASKPATPAATPVALHGPAADSFSPAMGRLLSFLARRALKRLDERDCQLSADAVLAERQARFRAMLDGVARDYGVGGARA